MLKQTLFLSIPIFSLMFSILYVSATKSNVYIQCSQLCFTPMTPYESNVNSLFTSLINSACTSNFNKFEISPPKSLKSDTVYGLFQCRGDLNSSNCQDCVASSISKLKTNCPVSIGGGIQLDGCFVKYDNSSFFGNEDKVEVLKRCGPSIGYNSDILNHIDAELTNLIVGNGQYFRASDYGNIQGVAQCVQDLRLSDCQDCLSEARGRFRSECETSIWGDMFLGKCYLRYADQEYGNYANNGNSSSNKSRGGGKSKHLMKLISAIVGGGLTLTATISVIYCCKKNIYKQQRKMGRDIEENQKEAAEAKKEAGEAGKEAAEAENEAKQAKSNAESAKKEAKEAKRIADGADKTAKETQDELRRKYESCSCRRPRQCYCPYKTDTWSCSCRRPRQCYCPYKTDTWYVCEV